MCLDTGAKLPGRTTDTLACIKYMSTEEFHPTNVGPLPRNGLRTAVGEASGGEQPPRWFTASRWTTEQPVEPPPATWRELGASVGNSFARYIQNLPQDPSQRTDDHETRHS